MERPMIPPVNTPYQEKVTTFRPGAIASVGDFFILPFDRAQVALFFCQFPNEPAAAWKRNKEHLKAAARSAAVSSQSNEQREEYLI